MKAVIVNQPGDASVLIFSDIPIPKPGPNQLLVKVHATALNRADISQRKGTYPPPPGHSEILGLEIAGDISDMGTEVKNFKKGDRVFGLVDGGGYAEYCLLDAGMALPIPENLTYTQAAAIPEAFLTAQLCMFQLGKLQKDETVLLHAAGSGIGTAAIQMAKTIGAKVFVTARSDEKIKKCLELGADFGVNTTTDNFFDEIKKHNDGVNLIIDPVGTDFFANNLNLLKMEGRLIQIAKMSGDKAEINLGRLMIKRIEIKGSTLRNRSLAEKVELNQQIIQQWLPLLASGKIKPIIDSTFPFDQVQDAHRYMESNKNFGKIILEL